MPFQMKVQLVGTQQAIKKLELINASFRRGILTKAVRAGAKKILRAARQLVPVRYGHLKKSLGVVIRVYRSGEVVLAAIGPRNGFRVQIGTIKKGPKKGQPIFEDPAKIAHLIEFGHGGPHPAPAHPFLRPALDGQGAAAVEEIRRIIEDEVAAILGAAA